MPDLWLQSLGACSWQNMQCLGCKSEVLCYMEMSTIWKVLHYTVAGSDCTANLSLACLQRMCSPRSNCRTSSNSPVPSLKSHFPMTAMKPLSIMSWMDMDHWCWPWLAKASCTKKTTAATTWVNQTHLTRKAKQMEKTVHTRLKNLTFLRNGATKVEGRLYTFLIQQWWLRKIPWRIKCNERQQEEQMEASTKRRVGYHRKEQQMDLNCLAEGKGCHFV